MQYTFLKRQKSEPNATDSAHLLARSWGVTGRTGVQRVRAPGRWGLLKHSPHWGTGDMGAWAWSQETGLAGSRPCIPTYQDKASHPPHTTWEASDSKAKGSLKVTQWANSRSASGTAVSELFHGRKCMFTCLERERRLVQWEEELLRMRGIRKIESRMRGL